MSFEPPVVLKTRDELAVDAPLYYEVASNGVFQVRSTPVVEAVTLVSHEIPGLRPSRERLRMKFPPLPLELVGDVVAFFREVYECYEGEAIVVVFYHPERRSYRAAVPPQRIPAYRDYRGRLRASLRLEYGISPRPPEHLPFGTIHSHADLSAYASGIDCDDERFGDGFHAIYGHFGTGSLSRCASFVTQGRRFRLDPSQVLPECEPGIRPAPRAWMEQVTFEEAPAWGQKRRPWPGSADNAPPLISVDEPGAA